MSDWKPIESAPRDGTHLLLYSAEWTRHAVNTDARSFAGGREPAPAFARIRGVYEGRWSDVGACWYSVTRHKFLSPPTHWMPLPDPPEGE